MKFIIMAAIAAVAGTGALAQDGQAGSHNPAVKDSKVHNVAAPAKGHSSFTEGQAKGHIENAGYTDVTGLTKSADGLWTGMAKKGGKSVSVAVDFKGAVTTK